MMKTLTDLERKELLTTSKNIAVVGLSANPERTSYMIAAAMQQVGYRIFPVNPMLTEPVLGEKPYASLSEIGEPIDIVNIFRRSEFVPPIVDEAIQIKAKAVWMQLGVIHEQAGLKAQQHGLQVVMDRCIKVEHTRLIGWYS
ncbi:hypothetical protein SAMN05444392_102458 [Seinonella peptonophila]|uniref:CoA-binding domain-containing protein n=1 Tax=Seinonella peptonophila TaxID=112248 RepID=A0A1M4VPE1_9BACL|nr:CoA-binding protein [Seinonella peptonophila]SHE70707.1 hypothetical protein SAMN05444392_102458 [Seinonella peptonophila]